MIHKEDYELVKVEPIENREVSHICSQCDLYKKCITLPKWTLDCFDKTRHVWKLKTKDNEYKH